MPTLPDAFFNELSYRYTLSALLVVLALLRTAAHKKGGTLTEAAFTPLEGPLLGGLRLSLSSLSVGIILVYLVYPPLTAWSQLPLPAWLRWSGAGLACLCLLLFWWVNKTLGHNFSATLRIHKQHSLVTTGPYQFVRHPMYTVLFSLLLGFSLLAANWVSFIGGVCLTLLIIIVRTPKEEAMLEATFGDTYTNYAAKTPRYFPSLR